MNPSMHLSVSTPAPGARIGMASCVVVSGLPVFAGNLSAQ